MENVETGDRIVYRTCPLCEATCGLEITVRKNVVTRIRGDRDDVFSHGFICPKGSTLKQLHEDPDRLRQPLIKRNGVHVPATWAEAWAEVARGLAAVIESHGRESIGTYLGNPNAHNLASLIYNRTLLAGIGSRQRYSASSVDQLPKQVSSGYMFGTPVSVAIPDIDRTQYILMLGANPYASNGSLCTAPDFPGRLEAMRARGGKLVVVDPRRSRTADEADEWLAIRPGTDALLLAAIANTLLSDGVADVGDHVRGFVNGLEQLPQALAEFTPQNVERATGISADTIKRIAHELNDAPSALVYGRIGTTTVLFGTTASWLIDVVNTLTGNLDSAGGVMFPKPATGGPTVRGKRGGAGFRIGRGHSRVSNFPEALGEYPVGLLAEEVTTAGAGQIRAFVTVAGNPVLSTPNSVQLAAALDDLEFMVSVDIYLNETTLHADVILPPPSHLERSHYDIVFSGFSIRNIANFSEPVLERAADQPDEWEILLKLAGIAQGLGADIEASVVDDFTLDALLDSVLKDSSSSICGRDAQELRAELSLGGNSGADRMLDLLLRTGPYGDGFGAVPAGLSLKKLRDNPHGIDLGALEPRLPEMLRTISGNIELAPEPLLADLPRLANSMRDFDDEQMVLVGRRHLRSNNSWMHNIEVLVRGKPRCTLHINPQDAARLGINDGASARVTSRVGSVDVIAEVTDSVREKVVSLPHGWGHSVRGTQMRVAGEFAGINSNVLTDEREMDPLSGTAVLNAIPVTVSVA